MKKCAVLVLVVLLLATGCATSMRSSDQKEQPAAKGEVPNVTYYTFPDPGAEGVGTHQG